MPGVDFAAVRQLVPLQRLLKWLGWEPTWDRGDACCGPCPVHRSGSPLSREFQVCGEKWYCFKCKKGGDIIDLWAARQGLDLHAAAINLCERVGKPVPWKHRPRRARRPRAPRNREEAR
jgi:hypothetical protein